MKMSDGFLLYLFIQQKKLGNQKRETVDLAK